MIIKIVTLIITYCLSFVPTEGDSTPKETKENKEVVIKQIKDLSEK